MSEKQISLYKHLITEALNKYNFADYFETSSKISLNINETFESLVEKILVSSNVSL